jgi:hypothetical protein
MHLESVVSPMRTLAFRISRSLTVRVPGGRIRAFGGGTRQIGAVLVVNLDRQPRRWRRVTRELASIRHQVFGGAWWVRFEVTGSDRGCLVVGRARQGRSGRVRLVRAVVFVQAWSSVASGAVGMRA